VASQDITSSTASRGPYDVAMEATRRRGPGKNRQKIHTNAGRLILLPTCFALALAAFSLVPAAGSNPRLWWSILGTSALLLVAAAILGSRLGSRRLTLEISLRPQHYLQACAQGTVLLYWGWYWPPVYEMVPLIAAQLAFAYAFDMLWFWSRRDAYTLGFSVFPVIFSINLFLWFKPEWFFLQFCMIAVGLAAKDVIRWERDGRRVHIFNPSSFPLALFSLGLILTGTTSVTFGQEIAQTQFNPPNIYVLLFLVGLPGQLLFGVTTMTMSAVVTTYLFGLLYFAVTGAYFFIDSYVPIAVFLGMHLLFTDPSTAPRSEAGRIVFGVIYGLSNVVLYALFLELGVPRFYDKLLPVPLMNLSVRFIDRWAPRLLRWVDPSRFGAGLAPRRRHLAYIAVWTVVFVAMARANGVGDNHPGHKVPFWMEACDANRYGACRSLGSILSVYCQDGSGWACNEHGVREARSSGIDSSRVAADFKAACAFGLSAGCANGEALPGGPLTSVSPRLVDYSVILRLGKGPLPDRTPRELYERACDQGFNPGCGDLAGLYLQGDGVTRDAQRAAVLFGQACTGGVGLSCSNLGRMFYTGDGIGQDKPRGLAYLKTACDRGLANACRWLQEERD
jgi:hypothetical protein